MDDFAVPGGPPNGFGFLPTDVNLIVPGKRPQSSMTPMIVVNGDNGEAVMVIGSSGGGRIITSIAQVKKPPIISMKSYTFKLLRCSNICLNI